LIPYVRNPRTHTPEQIAQVAGSIREFGWTNPVLIDEEGGIIAGHARVEAARQLGYETVPTIELVGLTDAQKRAYVVVDNRLPLNAGWDDELLHIELADLKAADFDLDLLGFDADELANLLEPPPEETTGDAGKVIEAASLEELAPTPEELERLQGRKVFVEFSGGKDSSAAAIWVKRFLPDAEVELCFVDLGADFIGFHFHLVRFAEAIGAPLRVLRAKQTVLDRFLEEGKWPHFAHPYCHNLLHDAMDGHLSQTPPEKCIMVRGGRLAERNAKTKAEGEETRFLQVERLKAYTIFQPLYFGAKGVCESILSESGMPVWEGYGRGLCRTACRVCPGQRRKAYAAVRKHYPDVWDELMELERRLGPGCWQDPLGQGQGSFIELADRGDKALAKGEEDEEIAPTAAPGQE
jgi:3'-phosphoadenosine 5'-phosphosulfate sulfotransferase (PAPS reductase)/FAD synthetase